MLNVHCADYFNRTWVLSAEEVMGPAERLKEECAKTGIEEGVFGVVGIGESVFV